MGCCGKKTGDDDIEMSDGKGGKGGKTGKYGEILRLIELSALSLARGSYACGLKCFLRGKFAISHFDEIMQTPQSIHSMSRSV